MRFSDQFLDDIRDRIPISRVVGEHIVWDKKKSRPQHGDFWACCPFHSEQTPSFHTDDRRGRYHCFGCQASGDHFRFLMEKTGLTFPEAVERLADMAGLPMPRRDAQALARTEKRQSLYDVMNMAAHYFEQALAANIGARTRGYIHERGVAPSFQQMFRLGYAPDRRNGLKEYLASNGVTAQEMIDCGLLLSGDDIAVPLDRFRNRLMFPITDMRGRVVAFGGRAMSERSRAKYLNSPETELFHKRRMLYNGHMARQSVHDGHSLVVVEGYMDVIALVQAGFRGAVAPLGTALTHEHVELLWQMADQPVLCFDGDLAGQRAADKSMDVMLPLLKPGKSAEIVRLPEGVDPDDLISKAGRRGFEELLGTGSPLSESLWEREIRTARTDTPESRAALEHQLASLTGKIADPSVRKHYGRAFNDRIYRLFRADGGFDSTARRRGAHSAGRSHVDAGGRGGYHVSSALKRALTPGQAASRIISREAVIVASVVNHPALAVKYPEELSRLELRSALARTILNIVLGMVGKDPEVASSAVRHRIVMSGLDEALHRIDSELKDQGIWQVTAQADIGDVDTGLNHALALHYKSYQLNRELKAAEIALGNEPSEESYERLRDIHSQITSVDGTEALIEGFGTLSGRSTRSV